MACAGSTAEQGGRQRRATIGNDGSSHQYANKIILMSSSGFAGPPHSGLPPWGWEWACGAGVGGGGGGGGSVGGGGGRGERGD